MSRVLSFLGFVLAIWIALEFYTKGLENAFGGVLAGEKTAANPVERTDRAADAFERSYEESIARVDRQLE